MVVIGDILQEAKTNTAGGLPANIHRFVAAQAEYDDTVRPDTLKGGSDEEVWSPSQDSSGKWRFIGIPWFSKCNNPGGHR